jgi:hypothetical protein
MEHSKVYADEIGLIGPDCAKEIINTVNASEHQQRCEAREASPTYISIESVTNHQSLTATAPAHCLDQQRWFWLSGHRIGLPAHSVGNGCHE